MERRALILLDTQTLVWHDHEDSRIGRRARELIEHHWRLRNVAVSAFTFWEITMNRHRRDFRKIPDVRTWRNDLLKSGLVEIPVDGEIAIAAGRITGMHGDPGDRIIMATAFRAETLVTSDEAIMRWVGPLDRFYAYD